MWLAVDKSGSEHIYDVEPQRGKCSFDSDYEYVEVPKGTIQRLLNYPLTWDDDCQEIVEYKNNTTLNDDKMIKQNIKIRVTPEQSKKIQEICFENGFEWLISCKLISYLSKPCLIIENYTITYRDYGREFKHNSNIKEIDADLFIRTNGTCEEITLNDESKNYQGTEAELLLSKMIDFKDEELEKHAIKIDNQKKQLEKYIAKIDNQKEEITRLLAYKERLQQMLMMPCKSVDNNNLVKLLEEKDAIIKYLENKLAKKTNEAYEKKVMSFEELYIKQADEYYKKVEDKVMGFVKKNLKRELNN